MPGMKVKAGIAGMVMITGAMIMTIQPNNEAQAACSADQRTTTFSGCLSLAKLGNALAQFDMSTRYFTGTEGVKRDEVLAYMWAKVCAQKERVTCGKLINILEMNMSEVDIAAAKEMASKCLRSNLAECN